MAIIDKDIGDQWRLREGTFPSNKGGDGTEEQSRLQVQKRTGTDWKTVVSVDGNGVVYDHNIFLHYAMASGQSIPNNVETVVGWPDKQVDNSPSGSVTIAGGGGVNWRFRVPKNYAGIYHVVVTLQPGYATGVGQILYAVVRHLDSSGAQLKRPGLFAHSGGTGANSMFHGCVYLWLNDLDQLDVIFFQNSGGAGLFSNDTNNNFVQVRRVADHPVTPKRL